MAKVAGRVKCGNECLNSTGSVFAEEPDAVDASRRALDWRCARQRLPGTRVVEPIRAMGLLVALLVTGGW